MQRNISCLNAGTGLPDCPKSFGQWINYASCNAKIANSSCGSGSQLQKRSCADGTGLNICTKSDTGRIVSCKMAGTDLPDCPKVFGPWKKDEMCKAIGPAPICGPGIQNIKRSCTNGTGAEICSIEDTFKTISCTEAGTQLPACPKLFGPWELSLIHISEPTSPY